MDWITWIAIIIKVVFVLAVLMTFAAILTWVERKQSAVTQDRVGANRVQVLGMRALGLFHIMTDSLKMFVKEDYVPANVNKFLHFIAPLFPLFSALVVFAVIPFGSPITVGGEKVPLVVAQLDSGLVYLFALSSLAVLGSVLAGWASHEKYAMLGGMRSAAQMISYEIALGVSVIGIVMVYNTLDISQIVVKQGELLWGFLPKWGIFVQPLAFFLFLPAIIAENKRVPFDLPEGESELVAGYFTEYSGMRWGMFFLAEFIEVAVVAAVLTTLFFGGWQFPYLFNDGFHFFGVWHISYWLIVLIRVLTFFVKWILVIWFLQQVRWTFPRFRYDQLMNLGWKIILPWGLINIVLTALVIIIIG